MSPISESVHNYYRYLGLVVITILGIVSVLGTGGGGGGDGEPQTITSVSPEQSSDSALVTALVRAQFSIDMNEASIDSSSFTLVDNALTPVTASNISYDVGARIATFEPSTDLVSGTTYLATVTTAVQDSGGGNPLSTDYVWSFQIAPTLVPVSQDNNGNFGNSASTTSSISADGRYIAFESSATNLVAGDTNGAKDIFLHDTQTNTPQLPPFRSERLLRSRRRKSKRTGTSCTG